MSFYQPENLPKIMIAPNGARPKKKDHIEVPVTIDEVVETAKLCFDEGAEGIHFHLRDEKGDHILSSEMCLKALNDLQLSVPNMHLQVTTEAVGRYSPIEMRNLAYEVAPPGISIGIREMIPSRNPTEVFHGGYIGDDRRVLQNVKDFRTCCCCLWCFRGCCKSMAAKGSMG